MTATAHLRDGKQVPEVEECVEIFGAMSEERYRHIHQIIGRAPGRHKGWAEHYMFGPLTTPQADALCAYLRTLALLPYDRETTRRWTP